MNDGVSGQEDPWSPYHRFTDVPSISNVGRYGLFYDTVRTYIRLGVSKPASESMPR